MNLVTFLVTFFGGGLFIYLIQEFRKSGKVELDDCIVTLRYSGYNGINSLTYFETELLFINTSEYSKIFRSFTAEFFDGDQPHQLKFENYNIRPAYVIEAKKATSIKLKLIPEPPHPLFHVIDRPDKPSFLKITYKQNKMTVDMKFYLSDMELDKFEPLAF